MPWDRIGHREVSNSTSRACTWKTSRWELMEYVAFIRTNPDELEGAYRDTMGDLTLSLLGSITGAALCATALWVIGRPVAIDPEPQTR